MQTQQNHTPLQESQPLVTFIITCYELPVQMLLECIDSILALSLRSSEREIIVVDDGSSVSPMNGLMQYGDDIVYVRQRNQGVSMARNTGIRMARGQYIQFVDGDDHLIQSAYEHCLDIVRINNSIEMVLFDFTSQSTSQVVFKDQPVCSGTEYMLHHNIHGTACGYFVKRSTLSNLRFTPGITNGEDEEFTPQLLIRAEQVCVTDARAYYYRQRKSSVVHQKDDTSRQKRLDDTVSVIKNLNAMTDRLPTTEKLAIQRRVAQLTMDHIYNTIVLTRSRAELERRLEELRAEGFFPLPDRDYSQKYRWFRKMTNSAMGRSILLHTLPLWSRER